MLSTPSKHELRDVTGTRRNEFSIRAFQTMDRESSFVSTKDTSKDWPTGTIEPIKVLEGGFKRSATKIRDSVSCSYCTGKLHRWRKNDSPLYEHIRNFRFCPLMQAVARQLNITKEAFHLDPDADEYGPILSMDSILGRNWENALEQVTSYDGSPDSSIADLTAGADYTELEIPKRVNGGLGYKDPAHLPVEGSFVKDNSGSVHHKYLLEANMMKPQVQDMIKLGFNETIIRYILNEKIKETGEAFGNFEKLALAVFEVEEKLTKEELSLLTRKTTEESEICVHCRRRERNVVIEDCNHFILCSECVQDMSLCPTCQCDIKDYFKIQAM